MTNTNERDMTSPSLASPLHHEVSVHPTAGSDFEIDTDSSSPQPTSSGHTRSSSPASNIKATRRIFHPTINGKDLFVNASTFTANSVTQEDVAERMASFQDRENGCVHLAHQP